MGRHSLSTSISGLGPPPPPPPSWPQSPGSRELGDQRGAGLEAGSPGGSTWAQPLPPQQLLVPQEPWPGKKGPHTGKGPAQTRAAQWGPRGCPGCHHRDITARPKYPRSTPCPQGGAVQAEPAVRRAAGQRGAREEAEPAGEGRLRGPAARLWGECLPPPQWAPGGQADTQLGGSPALRGANPRPVQGQVPHRRGGP